MVVAWCRNALCTACNGEVRTLERKGGKWARIARGPKWSGQTPQAAPNGGPNVNGERHNVPAPCAMDNLSERDELRDTPRTRETKRGPGHAEAYSQAAGGGGGGDGLGSQSVLRRSVLWCPSICKWCRSISGLVPGDRSTGTTGLSGTGDVVPRVHSATSSSPALTPNGVAETIARGPLEAVKNMVQLQQRINLRRVAKASGVMLCREVPGNIAYFTTYEMARAHGAGALVSGALAGVTFAFLTFPIDTIRTQVAAGQRPRPSYRGVSGFALRIGGYGALMFAFNEFLWERVAGHVWEDK